MILNIKKLFPIQLKIIVACVMLMAATTACNDDDDTNIEPVSVAYVSLYQASPDAPELDIIVDNRRINTYPFDYGDYTGYLRFYTGERNLKFGPFGASNIVADTTVTFEEDRAYSVFVTNAYANLDVLVFPDNAENPADGNALVRFIHLSPDAPAVNLLAAGTADPLFSDQTFQETPEFIEVPADEYDFEVTTTDGGETVLAVPDVDLQAGWYYTIMVRGFVTPPTGNSNILSAEVIVN